MNRMQFCNRIISSQVLQVQFTIMSCPFFVMIQQRYNDLTIMLMQISRFFMYISM